MMMFPSVIFKTGQSYVTLPGQPVNNSVRLPTGARGDT